MADCGGPETYDGGLGGFAGMSTDGSDATGGMDAGGSSSGGSSTGGSATGGSSSGGSSSGGSSTGGADTGGSSTGGSGTGGSSSGGASTGGASSGGQNGTGGATGGVSTGGSSSGGAGGQVASTVIWRDSLQTGSGQWGFDEILCERDSRTVSCSSAASALTRVTDPVGTGFALRHVCTFDQIGCRSEAGLWSFRNTAFGAQAKKPEGVWVAMEWYFPVAVTAGNDDVPWVNTWDWHSTDGESGANRWHTSPGLMLHEDGSMRARWEWGDDHNRESAWTGTGLPVGRWFDIEMHYTWSTSATLELWVDGQAVLKQTDVKTRQASHTVVEMYDKWYGAQNDGSRPWSPSPATRYTRNVRVGNGRIWPQK